jgi:hypothetical protein
MNGKSKCKILKQIRQQIAAENDISYVVSECKHQGDCLGTCPKCEAEVRYLEEELHKKQLMGKKVAVAGVAATIMLGTADCDLIDILSPNTGGEPLPPSGYEEQIPGRFPAPTDPTTMGKPTEPTTEPMDIPGEVVDVMGDVVAPPEE